jgi:CheY-like chemotaxis protein
MSIQAADGEPVSILVADDEDTLRDVISLHLRNLGYDVHEAHDGAEALAMAQELLPALIVLDITMPKLNGWEVARRLRSAPATAGIKLLMLSGIGGEVLGAGLPVLGGDLGLDKPFELEELEAALAELLGTP